MNSKGISNNLIAFVFGILAVIFTAYIFLASRNDPGLRMAALVSATGTAASLLAIASTLLTGKDLTQNSKDLPPGTTQITQLPPTTATVTVDPTQPKE